MRHLVQITPAALQAAEGMYICVGKVPKAVKMTDKPLGDETEVLRDSESDPLTFINPGKFYDAGTPGSVETLTAGLGIDAFQGNESAVALLPVEYNEDVNGNKVYKDHSGREIFAFRIDDNTLAALDVVMFDINGATQTMTEGTEWIDDSTAALTAVALAAYITASVSNVTAVAEGIVVYLIQEVGYVLSNLDVTGTGISHHNQPVVYDVKGNLSNIDPNLKSKLSKGIKVTANLITSGNPLQFDIEV